MPANCVHRIFEQQTAKTPGAIAITFGKEQLTYAQLDARSNQLASHLRQLGVGPESLVGVYLERSPRLIVALLATLKAGGGYLPIDPSCPADRLRVILEDAQPKVLLTESSLSTLVPREFSVTVNLDHERPAIPADLISAEATQSGPENLAYVIYTSGSTGVPKGVMVTHANVTRLLSATEPWFHFGPSDVWTLFHSSAFDFSVWEIWACLLTGGRLVIVPFGVSRSPSDFYELLSREKVTVLNQTPSAFYQLIQVEEEGAQRELHLRFVIFGGEALNFSALRPWFNRHGDQSPTLVNMYGITETTVHVTYRALVASDAESGKASMIGEPIPDLKLYLLDDRLQPVPAATVGEIYVGGAGVARGYLNRPELTRERFLSDPFADNSRARMYKSGDLARRHEDGELEYLGRNDTQVKINGFRIEIGEIEAAVVNHPQVLQSCVVLHRDEAQTSRLVAYYVTREDVRLAASDLSDFLGRNLPPYMMPAIFMQVGEIPLTVNGKVDRAALPAPVTGSQTPAQSASQPPGSKLEEEIAAVWKKTLRSEHVHLDDNFFSIGGNSLLLVRVHIELQKKLQKTFPVTDMFEFTTIRQLAHKLGNGHAGSSLDAVKTKARKQRMAFARRPAAGQVAEGTD